MTIEFNCPSCNREIRTSDANAGKRGKCPQCQSVLQIPASGPPTDELEPLDSISSGPTSDPLGSFPSEPTGGMQQSPFQTPGFGGPATPNPYADPGAAPTPNPYAAPRSQQHPSSDEGLIRWILPIGTSPFAIAAGYLGLLSLGCCLLGPLALVAGIAGIVQLQKNPNLSGMGRCIVGIVLGLIGSLGLLAVILAMISGAFK